MQVLNQQEVTDVSGGVELFPGVPGLPGGLVTISAGLGAGLFTILSNVTLGLAQIFGVPAPKLH